MGEWTDHKLGDLIESVSETYKFIDKEVIFINTSDILAGKFLHSEKTHPQTLPGQAKKKIKRGDFLFSEIRPANKRYAMVDFDSDEYVVSTKLMVLRKKTLIDTTFLKFILTSKDMLKYLQIVAEDRSGTFPQITFSIISDIDISLPPLPEQKAIASVLSSLDDKIEMLHRQNKTLETMAETLFRQRFVEEAQDDWEEIPLSFIGEHKKINIRPDKNPTKLYRHYSIPAFDDGKHPVQELGSEIKSNKYRVLANSILISKLNPRFPRVWALSESIDDNSICSTEFQVVLPIKYKFYGLIYCFLKSNQVTDELIGAAGGTSGSHQRVKPEDIFNLTLQIPDAIKLDEFNSKTSEYWKRIANNNNQILTLQKLRDTLLPKLMSGKVRVEYEQERDC